MTPPKPARNRPLSQAQPSPARPGIPERCQHGSHGLHAIERTLRQMGEREDWLDSLGEVGEALRAWRPPFNPTGVVEEAAALLKRYHVDRITGDKYAGEWPQEAFRAHGITYEPAEQPKSELYLALLPVVNAGRIELPDLGELLRELRGLDRRRGGSERDRVDRRPGAHDDRANAIAGSVSLLSAQGRTAAQAISALEGAGVGWFSQRLDKDCPAGGGLKHLVSPSDP